jgi:hypothetical protein
MAGRKPCDKAANFTGEAAHEVEWPSFLKALNPDGEVDSTIRRTSPCCPMARPTLYQPVFVHRVRCAARLGMDNTDLAGFFSVSPATLYRWLNRYPDFAAAAATGRAEAANPAVPSRYQRAVGYERSVERVFMPRGAGEPVTIRYKRRILADVRVALRWLRNRQPETWTLDAGASDAAARAVRYRLDRARRSKISGNDSHNPATIAELMTHTLFALILSAQASQPDDIASDKCRFLPQMDYTKNAATDVSSHNTRSTDATSTEGKSFTSADLPVVNVEPGRLERPDPNRPPQPRFMGRQDQPQRTVPHRLRGIPGGGHRLAARMRMIMPDHPRPAASRGTMRREQRRRVYFERPRRVRRHIRARFSRLDPPFRAEQQPANLRGRGIFRVG